MRHLLVMGETEAEMSAALCQASEGKAVAAPLAGSTGDPCSPLCPPPQAHMAGAGDGWFPRCVPRGRGPFHLPNLPLTSTRTTPAPRAASFLPSPHISIRSRFCWLSRSRPGFLPAARSAQPPPPRLLSSLLLHTGQALGIPNPMPTSPVHAITLGQGKGSTRCSGAVQNPLLSCLPGCSPRAWGAWGSPPLQPQSRGFTGTELVCPAGTKPRSWDLPVATALVLCLAGEPGLHLDLRRGLSCIPGLKLIKLCAMSISACRK